MKFSFAHSSSGFYDVFFTCHSFISQKMHIFLIGFQKKCAFSEAEFYCKRVMHYGEGVTFDVS